LSPELRARIEACVQDQKDNVRASLKDVYMFPQRVGEYTPFVPVPWDVPELPECQFKIKLVDGKVYAQQVTGPSFGLQVFEALEREAAELKLQPIVEPAHVTLVNSDEVAQVGLDRVLAAIEQFNARFGLQVGQVMTTVSRDWVVFADCAVVKVTSPELEKFAALFPEIRAKSHHVTFGQRPRALKL
jgi:hypothetical protein